MRKDDIHTIDTASLEHVTGGRVNWPKVLKWGDRIAEGINLAGIGTDIWNAVRPGGGTHPTQPTQPAQPAQPTTPAH